MKKVSFFHSKIISKRKALAYRSDKCLNCQTPLDIADRYCHYCGQINSTKKISFSDFIAEFFASIFSYDSRLRRTIAALFIPGKITKDYTSGKRMRYANPFRFYLSISIVFFLLNGLLINEELEKADQNLRMQFGTHKNFSDLKFSQKKDSILTAGKYVTDSLNDKKALNIDFSKTTSRETDFGNVFENKIDTYYDFHQEHKELSTKEALKQLQQENTWFNRTLYSRIKKFNATNFSVSGVISYLLSKLPIIIFFFLPAFALVLWLLYIRRPFNYMDHLVFTFHQQTVFFILLGFGMLLDITFNTDTSNNSILLAFLIYLFLAMKKFYGQGKIKTTVKFLLANFLFSILAVVGSIITLLGAAILY
ncbi:DUF3667 domain-containing protein [Aquimarina sp. ERC-38]|uniref:DUF3667 domain-containing protein n=1 Tax=Aquimarina sp. ERC-38 TaxID=2949996 RepID=UPI0022465A7C|nr:DUF3667 domain-containing protein [Aquimarina sp. ERC-38]UZO82564.1 DUF3667 domain-containing protein [Aquimarina sp. ERC-38]